MAYEQTTVAVPKSQEGIRRLIQQHQGFSIAFISDSDPALALPQEGFMAKVMIEGQPYQIRVMAKLKLATAAVSATQAAKYRDQEERRIWRVLYYHMKSVFEAADSGVMEFRELMLPYIVVGNGQTIAEALLPRLDAYINSGLQLAERNQP